MPIFNFMKRNRAELQVQVMTMNATNETSAAKNKLINETFQSVQLVTVLWQTVLYTPYTFLLQISCFITVLLSTTRMIAMMKPLYIIRQKMVLSAFAISITFLLSAQIPKYVAFISNDVTDDEITEMIFNMTEYARTVKLAVSVGQLILVYIQLTELALVAMMVVVVVVNSVLTIRALNFPTVQVEGSDGQPDNSNNRRATVMILLLSLVFVIVNGIWLISILIIYVYIFAEQLQLDGTMEFTSVSEEKRFQVVFITLVMMPANSIANPLIYIARNTALNEHVRLSLRRFVKVMLRVIQVMGNVLLSPRTFI